MQARSGDAGFMLRKPRGAQPGGKAEAETASPGAGAVVGADPSVEADFSAWRTTDTVMTDYESYHTSIWTILEKLSVLVFRKNREVVPLFLDFFHQYRTQWGDDGDDEDAAEGDSAAAARSSAGVNKKLMNASLCDYLRLFRTFRDAANMRSADQVRDTAESLLTKAEPEIQQLAVDCLIPFRKKQFTLYAEVCSRLKSTPGISDSLFETKQN